MSDTQLLFGPPYGPVIRCWADRRLRSALFCVLCVCVCSSIFVFISFVCLCSHVPMCIQVCIHVCICVCVFVFMRALVCMCVFVCVFIDCLNALLLLRVTFTTILLECKVFDGKNKTKTSAGRCRAKRALLSSLLSSNVLFSLQLLLLLNFCFLFFRPPPPPPRPPLALEHFLTDLSFDILPLPLPSSLPPSLAQKSLENAILQ